MDRTTPTPAQDRQPGPGDRSDPAEALTPELALDLARRQRIRVEAVHLVPVAVILLSWALAWGAGFLLVWLAAAPSGGEPVLSAPAAGIASAALLIGALLVSAILGARTSRGIRAESGFAGLVYGLSWTVGTVAALLLGLALALAGADAELLTLYFPAGYALTVGLLFLAGAALFRAVPMLALGSWTLLAGIAAPFFGAPANLLVMSVLGGGGFLLCGLATLVAAGALRGRSDLRG